MTPITIPLTNYRIASAATRAWAKKTGISPVKATKALSETTRDMFDESIMRAYEGYSNPTQNTVKGLEGLMSRLSTGDRSNRSRMVHNPLDSWEVVDSPNRPTYRVNTHKGAAIDTFGTHLSGQLGMGKNRAGSKIEGTVFSKAAVAKKRAASKKAGPKGGMR